MWEDSVRGTNYRSDPINSNNVSAYNLFVTINSNNVFTYNLFVTINSSNIFTYNLIVIIKSNNTLLIVTINSDNI